ncbi:MAG: replication protein [Candidatus Thorarchaeota archaeon]|jgi:hypothetical protein
MAKIKPFEDTGGYTTFDNAILDLIMPLCKPNTWKILCATIRKTRGWGKEQDAISITQFMRLTGIKNRSTVVAAIQDSLDMGLLICDDSKLTNVYSLNRKYEIDTSTEIGLVQNLDQNRYRNRTKTSPKTGHTKEKRKEINNTEIPSEICTSKFKATWEDFKTHRKQIKSPMTPLAETRMLKKLSTESVEVAIGMLDQSIENGWKGVFELKNGNAKQIKKNLPEGI